MVDVRNVVDGQDLVRRELTEHRNLLAGGLLELRRGTADDQVRGQSDARERREEVGRREMVVG